MSVSRFRHTHTTASKQNAQFLNVSSSEAIWLGSNMIACNQSFVALPWKQRGSVAVFSHTNHGKISPNPPLLSGHEGAVIDVQFNPYHTNVYTAGEDGAIMGWQVPENGLTETCTDPASRFKAHDKKCGTIVFHPSASGVLASAALDNTVKIWDLQREDAKLVLDNFEDHPADISWNLDGTEICVVSRDKNLTIFDSRDGTVAVSGLCHESSRALRCVWAKRKNQIITLGWDNMQRRQVKVWDTRKMSRAVSTTTIDQGSAAMMPMYDEDLNLLYIGYKGEGAIQAYELEEGSLVHSHVYSSAESVKGVCMFPKQCLDVKQCEIARIYTLGQNHMMSLHMNLPRKQSKSEFQRDAYPPTFADKAALTAKDFFEDGKAAPPCECDLEYLFDGTKPAVKKVPVTKEADVSSVRAMKKPPKKEATQASAHADPTANMAPEKPERNTEKLESLMVQLQKQREEIEVTRRQLAEKESEMMETLTQIQAELKN